MRVKLTDPDSGLQVTVESKQGDGDPDLYISTKVCDDFANPLSLNHPSDHHTSPTPLHNTVHTTCPCRLLIFV